MSKLIMDKWNRRFFMLAREISTWSKDPRTQVGAVIIRPNKTICSTGYNGFARGMDDSPEMYANPQTKYERVVHAEMNAILTAPEPVRGYSLYCTLMPCADCAKLVIQSGIAKVFCPVPAAAHEKRWDFNKTRGFFQEAGIQLFEAEIQL